MERIVGEELGGKPRKAWLEGMRLNSEVGDRCASAEARLEEPGGDAVDGEVSPVLTTQPTGVDGDRATTCDTGETVGRVENGRRVCRNERTFARQACRGGKRIEGGGFEVTLVCQRSADGDDRRTWSSAGAPGESRFAQSTFGSRAILTVTIYVLKLQTC